MNVEAAAFPQSPPEAPWEALFPVTAAWTRACCDSGELWLCAYGETVRAFADMAGAQTELCSQAVDAGFKSLAGGGWTAPLIETELLATKAQVERFAEVLRHTVEDFGPGRGGFNPLPD